VIAFNDGIGYLGMDATHEDLENAILVDNGQQLGGGIQQPVQRQGQHHQAAALQHSRVGVHRIGQLPRPGPLRRGGPVHQGLHADAAPAQVQPQGAADQAEAHDPHGPK
jgi:hypothetical protein